MPILLAEGDYHVQEKIGYCGVASAITILADPQVGVKYGTKGFTQDDLYKDWYDRSGDWYISPWGLEGLLNKWAPAKSFAINWHTSPRDAAGQVVAAIHQHKIPAAVLSLIDGHWVTVNAVDVDVSPNHGQYVLRSLCIYNPENQIPGRAIAHGPNDECAKMPVRDCWLPYPAGWSNYLRDIMTDYGGALNLTITRPVVPIDLPKSSDVPPLFEGMVLAPKNTLKEKMRYLLTQSGFFQNPRTAPFLAGSTAGSPLYVKREGQSFGDYFLVSMVKDGKVMARVQVDAYRGHLLALQIGYREMEDKFINAQVVRGYFADRVISIPGDPRPLVMMSEIIETEETLTWKPCPESLSPFLPFQRLWADGREVNVRLDGRTFGPLSPLGRGM